MIITLKIKLYNNNNCYNNNNNNNTGYNNTK